MKRNTEPAWNSFRLVSASVAHVSTCE